MLAALYFQPVRSYRALVFSVGDERNILARPQKSIALLFLAIHYPQKEAAQKEKSGYDRQPEESSQSLFRLKVASASWAASGILRNKRPAITTRFKIHNLVRSLHNQSPH